MLNQEENGEKVESGGVNVKEWKFVGTCQCICCAGVWNQEDFRENFIILQGSDADAYMHYTK